MANTLTALQRVYHNAAHNVSRELTGVIKGANTAFDSKGAALNETIKVPRIGSKSTSSYTPAMTTTAGSDQTPTVDELTISNSKNVTWNLRHEDMQALENAGNLQEFMRQNAEEAMRALVNEVESDLWTAGYQGASRATGTAGTNPFATTVDAVADVRKILDDNGAPPGDRTLVINTTAGASLRKRYATGFLAGADAKGEVQSGALAEMHGLMIRESAQISLHTKGTGTGYLINNASDEVVGQTALTVDTGSGTLLAGDIITHASDSANKYVSNAAIASNTVTIGRPGLLVQADDDDAITIGASYTPNLAFARSALCAVVRPPIIKPAPNMTSTLAVDPDTGLTFLVMQIMGDGMDTYRVHLCWGVSAIQSEHIAILIG